MYVLVCGFLVCRLAVDDAYLWNSSRLSDALGLSTERESTSVDDQKDIMDLTSDENATTCSASTQSFDSSAYVDICGVSLPRKQRAFLSMSQPSSSSSLASELAMVESTKKNLHDVALAISEVPYDELS